MNNRGVITRGMVLLASIILFAVIGTVIAIMVGKNKSDDKYKLFENELVTGAQNYFIIKNMDIDEGEEKRINMSDLAKNNLIYNDLKDKCNGYVLVSNEKDIPTDDYNIEYRAYIKCGNRYMTVNYSEY